MTTSMRAMIFCASLCLLSGQALGDDAAPAATTTAPSHPGDVQHRLSLTLDPILLLPIQSTAGITTTMLELTGEYRIADRWSAAGILGGGLVTSPAVGGIPVFEIGGQFLAYPIGYFEHGMQLGVEVIDLPLVASINGVTATGNGIALGPLVGYKLATNLGFSLNIQGGVGYEAVVAAAQSGGARATAQAGSVIPLLRINLGWSL